MSERIIIPEKYQNKWWKISPFFYDSVIGYRCFQFTKTRINSKFYWKIQRPIQDFYRFTLLKYWYCARCQSCGHTLYHHVSYFEIADREGICVNGQCFCEDFR